MTQFKCKQSGNIVEFFDPQDIESMRKESHYEEVKNEIKIEEVSKDANADAKNADETEVLVKRGRPAKSK